MRNVLVLDASIYAARVIMSAIRDFSKIARIELITANGEYVCRFVKTEYDLELTIREFENYVIDLSNQQRVFD